ncbi:MAG: molybdopterin molybdotransferase MoeA [Alphaproteobacteria bacterium]|nr:molybdopterin molybdotransferase MoeA [Alphaproteobacteria bacterium]
MISVDEARQRIAAAMGPVGSEVLPLDQALGRVLAEDVAARVSQPPVAVSAMDGYAVRAADVQSAPVTLRRGGEAPAGGSYPGKVKAGETVRIFTGGPLPAGADTVVLQENTEASGASVVVKQASALGRHVRGAGLDFQAGQVLLRAGRRLRARDIGLAAAMNVPALQVRKRPRVAVLSTGSELVPAGGTPGPNQIIDANGPALAAVLRSFGAEPVTLGIARDDVAVLQEAAAGARGADLLLTLGGASVGEHDLIQKALGSQGLAMDFWKVAIRPGKPLMFGRLGDMPLLGLPGNPVSALVCALVFVRAAIDALLGAEADREPVTAILGRDLDANDGRQDYLRSELGRRADGSLVATPLARQDSSMLASLASSGCLVVRPPNAPPLRAGAMVPVIPFSLGPEGF